jgi:hypothetical protein
VKIKRRVIFNQHQSIGANAKLRMAYFCDLLVGESQFCFAIIDDHKVVASCLIFMEVNCTHFKTLKLFEMKKERGYLTSS